MNAKRFLGLLSRTAISVSFVLTAAGCSQNGPGVSGSGGAGGAGNVGGTSALGTTDVGGTSNMGGTTNMGSTSNTVGTSGVGGTTNMGSTSNVGGTSNLGGSASGGTGTISLGGASTTGGVTGKGGTAAGGATTAGGAQSGGAGGARAGGSGPCSGTSCSGGSTSTGIGGSVAGNTSAPGGATATCGAEHFKDWSAGKTPKEVGLKLAKLFDSQAVDTTKHYKTACTWYGALSVAGLLEDASLKTLISKFDSLVPNFVATSTERNHVDDNVFGIVPLEIYLHNSNTATRDLGLALADHQIQNISSPDQMRMAIDDMFMITGLQVQAYRAADSTKKAKYLDFAAETMVKYLAMQKADGCFFQKEGANAKWGRGNGWFAVGMAEMMRELPAAHKHYATIRSGYEKMMKGLLDYQIKSGEGAGIWYQVIDSKDAKNWPETSGSAMFAYAMITGVKLCILDAATYGPAARAAWNTLTDTKYLGADGKLKEISDWCYWQTSEGDALTYYITMDGRTKVVGDGHGQAPMLWAAAALLRP